jgi:hypothetical protein
LGSSISKQCCLALWLVLACAPVSAARSPDLAELDARCEAAREVKIAPLREEEIRKCNTQRNDPAYCERYWADYGDATLGFHGQMVPRLFNDLPECDEATKARNQSSRGR